MAHGDRIARSEQADVWTLLDAAAATADGVWVDVNRFVHGSLDVVISATATVQLRGSNAATIPANNTDGRQIGSDITASALYAVEYLPRWIKAKVSSFGSGTVTAILKAMQGKR